MAMQTESAKKDDVERKWYVVDASEHILGRLATALATVLRGKHKPQYTPHVDTGDFVVVINADKVRLTGRKEQNKIYYHHTGYPGGIQLGIVVARSRWVSVGSRRCRTDGCIFAARSSGPMGRRSWAVRARARSAGAPRWAAIWRKSCSRRQARASSPS